MLSIDKTLKQILELLSLLPTVVVTGSHIQGKRASIALIVGTAESMRALQHATEGANAGFQPWIELSGVEEELPPTECVISVSTARSQDLHCGFLQLLGVFLAWRLHRAKIIDTRLANRLLRKWHGALVNSDPIRPAA